MQRFKYRMLWRTETPDLDANDITRRYLLVEISLPSLNDYLRATFFTNSIIIINITLKSLADFERQPRIEDARCNGDQLSNCCKCKISVVGLNIYNRA